MSARLGKYEIIRAIGKGAMGQVYLAKDTTLGREVALKTSLSDIALDEAAMAIFENEARAAAALNHPNIVTVFDFGREGDKAYLVMEYVEGETLETLIAKGEPKHALLEVLCGVCDGLAYAHDEGLVHRDIKPENIIIGKRGKKQHAKLVDFSVAQTANTKQPGETEWMGTPHYIAPEYLKTGNATASSDIFALGVVLYEILSGGRKPFDGDGPTGTLDAILSQPPSPLKPQDISGLSPAFLRVAEKALAKEPQTRFLSADMLGQAISEALRSTQANLTAGTKPELMNVVVGRGVNATCLSLRVALRQAAAGANIQVMPGVYRESIVLEKDVTIVGEGNPSTIVIESSGPPTVRVKGGRPSLTGLTIKSGEGQIDSLVDVVDGHLMLTGCQLAALGNRAAQVESGAELTMNDCVTTGHGRELLSVLGKVYLHGGHFSGATTAAISIFSDGSGEIHDVQMGPGDGVAVMLDDRAKAHLENVVVNGFDEGGIELNSASDLYASECQFVSSKYAGLIQKDASKSKMENCQFNEHEGAGVHVAKGSSAELSECTFDGNTGYAASVIGGAAITLESCEISSTQQTGVVVHNNGKAKLDQCRIVDGGSDGIHCYPGAEASLVSCEINNNAKQAIQVDSGGHFAMKQCAVHGNMGAGLVTDSGAEVYLESCVIQKNAEGSILLQNGARPPTLLGRNQIDGY